MQRIDPHWKDALHAKHGLPTLVPAWKERGHLLCIPNSGNMPPKDDRVKLFAARALAANVGYASTRNVKTPEYTRIVLAVTRSISTAAEKARR